MKKTLMTALFLTSIVSMANGMQSFTADIGVASMDQDWSKNNKFLSGTINVNEGAETLNLSFTYAPPISAGCMAIGLCNVDHIATKEVSVAISKVVTDECNVTTYTGKEDNRIASGSLDIVEVIDLSESTCPILATHGAWYMSQVKYTSKWVNRQTLEDVEVNHTFFGNKLSQDPWVLPGEM